MSSPTSSSLSIRPSLGPVLQASKWQKCPVLLDIEEMRHLIVDLGKFWMVQVSGLISLGEEILSFESFLEHYHMYITALKNGRLPDEEGLHRYFSAAWTDSLDAVYAVCVKPQQVIVRVEQPVIQLQIHQFSYSRADGKFHSMAFGDAIHWGIQFSFPYLFRDAKMQVFSLKEGTQFPNASLFKSLQRWIRAHTIATPFEVDNQRIHAPIRLGKQCLNWIHAHPQLNRKGLRVVI